ncbi:MAG TPA: hypothetical protein VF860_02120 [Candidatus Acidoferrales bacterium]
MRKQWMILAVAAVGFSFGAIQVNAQGPRGAGAGGTDAPKDPEATHSGHSLNPIKWVKKDSKKTVDANSDRDKQLTSRLQARGLVPANADLAGTCAGFKSMRDCLAAIHASHNAKVNFTCLKWDMTGVQPKADVSSCGTPGSGGMNLRAGIQLLNPDANAKVEAKVAEKQAHNDLK